jgi:hypothetical protein
MFCICALDRHSSRHLLSRCRRKLRCPVIHTSPVASLSLIHRLPARRPLHHLLDAPTKGQRGLHFSHLILLYFSFWDFFIQSESIRISPW